MKLKLSKAQLQALEQELNVVSTHEHIDLEDKLLALLLNKLYKRIVVKLLDIRAHYSIQLDDETAMALLLYFRHEPFNPASFNDQTLKQICDNIDRKYA